MNGDPLWNRWQAALAGRRPLLLDGAVGTELERRGVDARLPLWSAGALLAAQDVLLAIHREYALAGADVLVANTFRTNPRTLARAGRLSDGPKLCELAVQLAKQAADEGGRGALVAASVAPVEDCYHPSRTPREAELAREHEQFADWLVDADADALWIETMGTQREAVAAARAARRSGRPFVVSFVLAESGTLLSGEPLDPALRAVEQEGALAAGLNCMPPRGITQRLPAVRAATRLPAIAYAHIGNSHPIPGWSLVENPSPEAYADAAQGWVERGAAIVGGCCGTTPRHIAAVRRRLDGIAPSPVA